jgi:hypothetical protein
MGSGEDVDAGLRERLDDEVAGHSCSVYNDAARRPRRVALRVRARPFRVTGALILTVWALSAATAEFNA